MAGTAPHIVSDLALSRRLERTEGAANAAFVDARAESTPAAGATWLEVNGTYAMFDGIGSPLTQTFGLGLFAPLTNDELDIIESFFESRGSDVFHEVSPMADPAILSLLGAREYRPIELSTVLFLPLTSRTLDSRTPRQSAATTVHTRQVERSEVIAWAEFSARGWSETPQSADFMRDFGEVSARARGMSCFVGEIEGEVVATGALSMHDGVAILAGASTIPAWRGRGAQTALLAARLAFARSQGCDMAMMGAAPGSTSQANAERQGFRIAYTRTKWQRGRSA